MTGVQTCALPISLAPMYLGVKAVVAKSFARIHLANLINFGIIPFVFADKADYDAIDDLDELVFEDVHGLETGADYAIYNKTKARRIPVRAQISPADFAILKAGGALNYIRNAQKTNS